MIELTANGLDFSFPDVHPQARLHIEFQRTLRIPDDGQVYHLPPGLGPFPLKHVDDFAPRIPSAWMTHGGVVLPMYQSEALWIHLDGAWVDGHETEYPFAVKVAAGKIDAVTGAPWSNDLRRRPQNYMVVPEQPWLDGFCVEKGVIRQFVAMPLGSGYSAEEQLTGAAEHGGLQILVHPMKREAFEAFFPRREVHVLYDRVEEPSFLACRVDMGLAPGGRMKQEILKDKFGIEAWDRAACSRCFVHLANSLVWQAITGEQPPLPPPTAKVYTDTGLPWFDYYAEGGTAVDGAEQLKQLKSVLEMGQQKGDTPLPENESVVPEEVVQLGRRRVREGAL